MEGTANLIVKRMRRSTEIIITFPRQKKKKKKKG